MKFTDNFLKSFIVAIILLFLSLILIFAFKDVLGLFAPILLFFISVICIVIILFGIVTGTIRQTTNTKNKLNRNVNFYLAILITVFVLIAFYKLFGFLSA